MITSLTVKNFKSFVNQTVPLGPLTLLLGGNGAGKSNLFDALRFLRSIGEGRSVRDAIEGHALPGAPSATVAGVRGGGAAATHYSSGSATFSLRVTMSIRGAGAATYFIEVDARQYRVVHEELTATYHPGPYVFSTRPETGPLERRDDSPSIPARFYKSTRGINPRREFSPFDFILSQFVSRRAESRLNEDVADHVRAELASIAPLELRPETLRQYSPLGRFQMGEHGENFAAAVWQMNQNALNPVSFSIGSDGEFIGEYDEEAQARRGAILAWLSEVTPRPIVDILTPAAPTGEVIFAVREEPFEEPVAAPSLSDGTLRFAALALVAINDEGRRTLVIEEIENGINPVRIALLLRMLEQVTSKDPSTQIFASTHSPALLDYASEATIRDAVVVGWDEDESSSKVTRIRDLVGISDALKKQTIGDLQEEGWLQLAAGI